jgi:hypothetical protein
MTDLHRHKLVPDTKRQASGLCRLGNADIGADGSQCHRVRDTAGVLTISAVVSGPAMRSRIPESCQ